LSDSPTKTTSEAPDAQAATSSGVVGIMSRLIRVLGSLRAWAYGHWIRGVIVAATMLTLIGLTIGGWAYLANVAIRTGELDAEGAMKVFDEGRFEEARTGVGRMLTNGRLERSEFGGPLLVLGAIKTKDAEDQPTAERRRIEYLVASRYLTEAKAYGLPENRQAYGEFLLGKSLIESGQLDEGVHALAELASSKANDSAYAVETLSLLTETCLRLPEPRVADALRHNDQLLACKSLTEEQRCDALLQRAECFSRLERFDESRTTLSSIPESAGRAAQIALLTGRNALDEVESALQKVPSDERKKAEAQYDGKISSAIADLQKANSLDSQKKHLADQTSFQQARALELKGDREAALKQYSHTRQLYGDTYDGIAAALMEGDLLRQKGDLDSALICYRRVLESFGKIPVYRSHVLPVARIRDRLMAAIDDLQKYQRFNEALSLIDRFSPPFTRAEQLELRGGTLELWGNALLSKQSDDAEGKRDHTAGLHKFRAAGLAFSELAELRYATRLYTADLWRGAEDFIKGQNFSHAIDLLNKYIENESELRNAHALLRLGQAHLALGHVPESIAAFEECIEFHPLDGASFQARIDCAKACWQKGDTAQAEQLLRHNIAGSSLKPASPEWRDSLFELGMLLHEQGKYEDAIDTLENAVERYPQDPQRLVAQYMIGESYRRWAQEFLKEASNSKTSSQREKILQEATRRLTTALGHFEEVQRTITLKTHDIHSDPLMGTMLRNCYMLEGAVYFDLKKYKEAIEAYSNVSSLYPDEPFVLETFVQIANCWRRLDKHENARGAVHQAQIALDRLPASSDFTSTTNLNRDEWRMLLASMSKW
jgi:tetratricopeptide (TPR) repeat protein